MFWTSRLVKLLVWYVLNKAIRVWKALEIILDNTKVRWYKNSKYGPAVAEEFALEQAGFDLLFGKDGILLPCDHEWIFLTHHMCSCDGDSKGLTSSSGSKSAMLSSMLVTLKVDSRERLWNAMMEVMCERITSNGLWFV
jgi:hypothetical protein